MSLIEVMLARKEVLISLIVVGLVLLSAVSLALVPAFLRRWKKMSARRQAARAARLAEAKRATTKKKRGRTRTATPKPAIAEAVDDVEAEEDEPEAPAAEKPAEVATASATSAAPAASGEPADPAATPEATAEAETETASEDEEEEQEKSADSTVSAMQDILDSVFVDEDVSGRYDVLLQGVEVGSAEEILSMANQIAAELGINKRKSE